MPRCVQCQSLVSARRQAGAHLRAVGGSAGSLEQDVTSLSLFRCPDDDCGTLWRRHHLAEEADAFEWRLAGEPR